MRWLLSLIVPVAAIVLTACGSSPSARNLSPEGYSRASYAEGQIKEQAEAVGLAQSGIPRAGLGLVYVYQEPGIELNGATLTLNGSDPYALRSGTFLVWEVEPGTHLLEAWRDGQRLASRSVTVGKDRSAYVKYAIKNNMGGLLYLQPSGPQEGRAFVNTSAFALN